MIRSPGQSSQLIMDQRMESTGLTFNSKSACSIEVLVPSFFQSVLMIRYLLHRPPAPPWAMEEHRNLINYSETPHLRSYHTSDTRLRNALGLRSGIPPTGKSITIRQHAFDQAHTMEAKGPSSHSRCLSPRGGLCSGWVVTSPCAFQYIKVPFHGLPSSPI